MSVLRETLRIAVLSVVVLVALLAALEMLLRHIAPVDHSHEKLLTLLEQRHGGVKYPMLEGTPLYVTDAHGLLVANHARDASVINKNGYRTPPFDDPKRGRTTLMFLGDSFTWGDYARPLSEAFPDVVRRAGYQVHNLGIGGVGVRQYRAEAALYVPQLKPDAVCVMFYPGNDFEYEPPIRPGFPRYYATDVALLPALTDDGQPIPLEQSIKQFYGHYGPGPVAWLRRQMAKSSFIQIASGWARPETAFETRVATAKEELRAIKEIAWENGARFFLFILWVRNGTSAPECYTANTASQFKEFAPVALPPMDESLYPPWPEYHYNTEGHGRVGAFIVEELKRAGLPPNATPPGNTPTSAN